MFCLQLISIMTHDFGIAIMSKRMIIYYLYYIHVCIYIYIILYIIPPCNHVCSVAKNLHKSKSNPKVAVKEVNSIYYDNICYI
jgi:hypothetical protein